MIEVECNTARNRKGKIGNTEKERERERLTWRELEGGISEKVERE